MLGRNYPRRVSILLFTVVNCGLLSVSWSSSGLGRACSRPVTLRFFSMFFCRIVGWLTLLARSDASENMEILYRFITHRRVLDLRF